MQFRYRLVVKNSKVVAGLPEIDGVVCVWRIDELYEAARLPLPMTISLALDAITVADLPPDFAEYHSGATLSHVKQAEVDDSSPRWREKWLFDLLR